MAAAEDLVRFAKEVHLRAKQDELTDGSAALAFWIFLSIFPALIAFVALLGTMETFIGTENANKIRREIIDQIDDVLKAGQLDNLRETVIDILLTPREGLAVVGVLAAVWGVSKGFAGLCRVLARIHGRPEARYGFRAKVVGLILGVGTLLVAVIAVIVFVLGPEYLVTGDSTVRDIWVVLRGPLAALLAFGWLLILLKVAPGMPGKIRRFLPGAAVAAGLLVALGIGTVLVVRLGLLQSNPLLGALGTVILVLGLLNLMARAVLIGGEVNDVRLRRRGELPPVRPQDVPAPDAAEPGPAARAAAAALIAAAFLRRR